MIVLCQDCKFKTECIEKKKTPKAIACCDYGLLDENFELITQEEKDNEET